MKSFYETKETTIYNADNKLALPEMPDCSIDSCVTDPPYELNFMNRHWDRTGIAYDVEMWKEVLRVLKPGAHLLACGGTRTAHRMACAIEDAGFEIRDSIHWSYGSGYPKSLNIGRSIDTTFCPLPGRHYWEKSSLPKGGKARSDDHVCAMTAEGDRFRGEGTALKPAHELIYLARKPLSEPNIAANVLRWGTGGLNIDACRIRLAGIENHRTVGSGVIGTKAGIYGESNNDKNHKQQQRAEQGLNPRYEPNGRWPSNVIFSHDPNCNGACVGGCPVRELDRQSGKLTSGDRSGKRNQPKTKNAYGEFHLQDEQPSMGDSGFASRFFHIAEWSADDLIPFIYCAKASRAERDKGLDEAETRTMNRVNAGGLEHDPRWAPIQVKNNHPTVKPVKLLEYLIKLITPPGGIVLDHFCGSGSTLRAADNLGFRAIGIEKSVEACEIAAGRHNGNIPPLFR